MATPPPRLWRAVTLKHRPSFLNELPFRVLRTQVIARCCFLECFCERMCRASSCRWVRSPCRPFPTFPIMLTPWYVLLDRVASGSSGFSTSTWSCDKTVSSKPLCGSPMGSSKWHPILSSWWPSVKTCDDPTSRSSLATKSNKSHVAHHTLGAQLRWHVSQTVGIPIASSTPMKCTRVCANHAYPEESYLGLLWTIYCKPETKWFHQRNTHVICFEDDDAYLQWHPWLFLKDPNLDW